MLRAFEVPVGDALLDVDLGEQRRSVACGLVGIDHRFDQRVGSEAVGSVQPRAGGFAQRVEVPDRGLAVGVDLHPAAAVVRCGRHGNPVAGDVDADRKAFFVDVGEVTADGSGVFVRDVEVDEVRAPLGHFAVDGAGHHVARRQRFHRVVFVHELLAGRQAQDGSETPHGLRDEEVGFLAGVVERRGVELDELHVLGDGLGAVAHGDAVARGDDRVGGRGVDVAAAARGDDGELGEHGLDLVGGEVEHIGAEAGQPARMARDEFAQVVLRQEVDGEMVFQHRDAGVPANRLDQRPFDLGAREVFVVEDAGFGMPALAVQLETSVGSPVEARAPFDQVADQLRGPAYDQSDGLFVAFAGSADQGVVDMFFECVGGVGHRADAALCKVGIALVHFALRDDRDMPVGRGLERERKARCAGTDNQKVGFHSFVSNYATQSYKKCPVIGPSAGKNLCKNRAIRCGCPFLSAIFPCAAGHIRIFSYFCHDTTLIIL